MTSDAPEKIWAHPTEREPLPVKDGKRGAWKRGKWKDHDSGASGDVGYTRTDIALAMVAAENDECARYADSAEIFSAEHDWPDGERQAAKIAKKIRARTDDDAKAALEAVKREAKNEALREAAELVRCSDFKHDAHDAILALIEEGDS